jgi:hypothetical protein
VYDRSLKLSRVECKSKKLHTGSVFIFLEAAALEVFAPPPPDLLFWVALDGGVGSWACADGVGLARLLSTCSFLGTTSCFGAHSGDDGSSSCWMKHLQIWILFHKIACANAKAYASSKNSYQYICVFVVGVRLIFPSSSAE